MKVSDERFFTPIYLKTGADTPWPTDEVFYLLTGQGLMLCRNHPFFASCVPARHGPAELAAHEPFLQLRYPTVPRDLLEQAVGFFAWAAREHGSEAAVLLAWDRAEQAVRLIVPDQVGTVTRSWWGRPYPVCLNYETPATLPPNWSVMGDIHSHVDGAAYSSFTDKEDENYRAGLHVVVGRIGQEPPDFHVEATVDGVRFQVRSAHVLEGYGRRRTDWPPSWAQKLAIDVLDPWRRDYEDQYASADAPSHADDARGERAVRQQERSPRWRGCN